MGCKLYKAKVPGSLMIMGEHAVLRGKLAIVLAVAKYLQVKLQPRNDQTIIINSQYFGCYKTSITKFVIAEPYLFVLSAIKKYLKKLQVGFTLEICADFPPTIGFGSSAAVTVATLKVLHDWLYGAHLDLLQLHKLAWQVILEVQGVGSGADVAAAVFGGVVSYRMRPVKITRIAATLPLQVVYSGNKVKTAIVVKQVAALQQSLPRVVASIDVAIEQCVLAAIPAIKNKNYKLLGKLMNIHHGLQNALGTSNATLENLVFELRATPEIYGAKISGSGLGDCVIGVKS